MNLQNFETFQSMTVLLFCINYCRLTEDYFLNLSRKFSAFPREIFTHLRDSDYHDPMGPAKKSIGKFGSLGNESASRVAPIALYGWNSDPSAVIDMSVKLSKITNYNKSGVLGSVFQALAVHTAFNWDLERPEIEPSTSRKFLRRLSTSTQNDSQRPVKSTEQIRHENIPLESKGSNDSKFFDTRGFCKNILDRIVQEETRTVSILENFKSFIHPSRYCI